MLLREPLSHIGQRHRLIDNQRWAAHPFAHNVHDLPPHV
jgi:hypothetical protein